MAEVKSLQTRQRNARRVLEAAARDHGHQSAQAEAARRTLERINEEAASSLGSAVAGHAREHVREAQERHAKDPIVKAPKLTQADVDTGVIARRKVRATGNIIERIDGSKHALGIKGGRWIIRQVNEVGEVTGKPQRYKTRKDMTSAARRS